MMNESLPYSIVTILWESLAKDLSPLRKNISRPGVVSGAIFSNDEVYLWSLKVVFEFLSDPSPPVYEIVFEILSLFGPP